MHTLFPYFLRFYPQVAPVANQYENNIPPNDQFANQGYGVEGNKRGLDVGAVNDQSNKFARLDEKGIPNENSNSGYQNNDQYAYGNEDPYNQAQGNYGAPPVNQDYYAEYWNKKLMD